MGPLEMVFICLVFGFGVFGLSLAAAIIVNLIGSDDRNQTLK